MKTEITEKEFLELIKAVGGYDGLSVYEAHTAVEGDEWSPHGEILTIWSKKGEHEPYIECVRKGFYPDKSKEKHYHYKFVE